MGGAALVDSADSSPEREQPDGRTTSARRISMGATAKLWQTSACFTDAAVTACNWSLLLAAPAAGFLSCTVVRTCSECAFVIETALVTCQASPWCTA